MCDGYVALEAIKHEAPFLWSLVRRHDDVAFFEDAERKRLDRPYSRLCVWRAKRTE